LAARAKTVIADSGRSIMSGPSSIADPRTDVAAEAVLRAFATARAQGRPPVECYRAGVGAWRQQHPEQAPEYAAKRAVAVILLAHVKLRSDN
jgi:hypothetical protein